MSVKKKYRIPLTLEQQYGAVLNRNLKGMSVSNFQASRTEYKKVPREFKINKNINSKIGGNEH